MTHLKLANVMQVAKDAVGDSVLWTSEAKDKLIDIGEAAIARAATSAAERVLEDDRVKVNAEDIDDTPSGYVEGVPVAQSAAPEPEDPSYTRWLEEANEAFAQALRKAKVPVPKLRPAPIVKVN